MSAPHPMIADEMKEIVDSFVVGTKEIFEMFDNEILEIEKKPDEREMINSIFRDCPHGERDIGVFKLRTNECACLQVRKRSE